MNTVHRERANEVTAEESKILRHVMFELLPHKTAGSFGPEIQIAQTFLFRNNLTTLLKYKAAHPATKRTLATRKLTTY